MGIDKIIESAVAIAILASVTGQLPKAIHCVQVAQFKLLEESKSSTWGQLLIFKK